MRHSLLLLFLLLITLSSITAIKHQTQQHEYQGIMQQQDHVVVHEQTHLQDQDQDQDQQHVHVHVQDQNQNQQHVQQQDLTLRQSQAQQAQHQLATQLTTLRWNFLKKLKMKIQKAAKNIARGAATFNPQKISEAQFLNDQLRHANNIPARQECPIPHVPHGQQFAILLEGDAVTQAERDQLIPLLQRWFKHSVDTIKSRLDQGHRWSLTDDTVNHQQAIAYTTILARRFCLATWAVKIV